MEMRDFQKKCVGLVKELDCKYRIDRDIHLSFAQMMEEMGELAKEMNKPRLRNKEVDRKNLR